MTESDLEAENKQQPVVNPKSDYSELPQKPITLKKGIGGLSLPGKKAAHSSHKIETPPTVTKVKKKLSVKKKVPIVGKWTLRGVSPAAREIAVSAAKQEGIKLGEWIEVAILQASTPSTVARDRDSELLAALGDIQARLERIEQQRGFFARLWEKIKVLSDPANQ